MAPSTKSSSKALRKSRPIRSLTSPQGPPAPLEPRSTGATVHIRFVASGQTSWTGLGGGALRRLALSLSDLASLRDLPGIRAHLDRLRPGETLTLTAKSGNLVGLERRLNIDQTRRSSL